MKINEIYKELDKEFSDILLFNKDIETWNVNDWNTLSELTQELVRRRKDE